MVSCSYVNQVGLLSVQKWYKIPGGGVWCGGVVEAHFSGQLKTKPS